MRWAAWCFVLLVGCTGTSPVVVSTSPSPVVQAIPSVTQTPTSTLLFRVGSDQARFVATVIAFFDAWNAGNEGAALALVTDDLVGGDCDARQNRPITWGSRSGFANWLREQILDRDRREVDLIVNENPDPSTGSQVVAVSFRRRTSDTLRSLGHADGIQPKGAAKIVFTVDGRKIRALNLPGAGAGSPCL